MSRTKAAWAFEESARQRRPLLEGAALALTAVITDLAEVLPNQPVPVACEDPDDELLLVD